MLAILALSAFPPFGIFRSEFQIVAGGLSSGNYAAAAALVVLVTLAFFGLATSTTSMLLTPAPEQVKSVTAQAQAPDASIHADGTGRAHTATITAEAPAQAAQVPARGEPSAWMVIPVMAGIAVLLLLGVHPPSELTDLITRAAAQLRGAP